MEERANERVRSRSPPNAPSANQLSDRSGSQHNHSSNMRSPAISSLVQPLWETGSHPTCHPSVRMLNPGPLGHWWNLGLESPFSRGLVMYINPSSSSQPSTPGQTEHTQPSFGILPPPHPVQPGSGIDVYRPPSSIPSAPRPTTADVDYCASRMPSPSTPPIQAPNHPESFPKLQP